MAEEPWRILLIEDDDDITRQVSDYLEGEQVDGQNLTVAAFQDFDTAVRELEGRRYDILIVDIFRGRPSVGAQQPGRELIQQVQQVRFVPIVVYTALPGPVQDLMAPLVRVVPKTGDGLHALKAAIEEFIRSGIPEVNRLLVRHVDAVQRDYMWNFVSGQWDQLKDLRDRHSLAYLLLRRLSHSLAREGVVQLAQALGAPEKGSVGADPDKVHPMEYYVYPPLGPDILTADLLEGEVSGVKGYWVVLTPSCDMVSGRVKAHSVLVARCLPLDEFEEFAGYRTNSASRNAKDALEALLRNNRKKGQQERYFFLPAALKIPNLVVDLQNVHSISFEQARALSRIASLDNPFAEALAARFARYFGRLGFPDLDTDVIIRQLTPKSE